MSFSEVCSSFVSHLVTAVRTEDPEVRKIYETQAGSLLECLVLSGVSFAIDSLLNPEPRDWKVYYATEGSRGDVIEPDEIVSAVTKNEAREIGEKRALKRTTMDRRVTVAEVREVNG